MEAREFCFNVRSYAVIILAAGNSSRLGSPKQLLEYKKSTLLEHSIDSALSVGSDQVIVVLGSGKDLIENKIVEKSIVITENSNWKSGIASSIKVGIRTLKKVSPNIDAVVLMVCDQPFADEKILKKLLAKQLESGKAIVGCLYNNTKGTPALFHSSLFPELLSLKGGNGAKKLFEKYTEVAAFVPFLNGGIDIDTSEDYKNLVK